MDDDVARRTIERALELGITGFDTAPTYGSGRSEALLGDVLPPHRDRVLLATKCGPHDDPRVSLEQSLRRLRTDYVDLLQLHEPPRAAPDARSPDALERRVEAMHALVDAGLARAIGVCNVSGAELERALRVAPVATYQGPLNLFDRDVERDAIAVARAHDVGVLAYRPLASGLLTGKFRALPTFEPGDHRARIHWFRGREFARRRSAIERLAPLADRHGLTLPQLALAWVLARPGVSTVLAGARTPTQVEENAGAATHALSPDVLAEIDAIVGDVYRPRALRAGVAVAAAPNAAGEYVVTRARTAGPLAVGEREAYVMRRLDGRTPYDEIASAWRPADGRRLLTAQVVLLVDQLAELGLLEET